MLTIALSKGRLVSKTVEILSKCKIICDELNEPARKLVIIDPTNKYKFIFVKPSDVPTYIERGAADIGIVGKDVIMEEGKDVYEMADLKIGACSVCVAGYADKSNKITDSNSLRVASKYVNIAKRYYLSKGINADIIKLTGSVELASVIDLADVIVDIVESGSTLKENGLCILEKICDSTARVIVNKVSLKLKSQEIIPLIDRIKDCIGV